MGSAQVSVEVKASLKEFDESLNPFMLNQQIEAKLRTIFQQLRVTSNVGQRL